MIKVRLMYKKFSLVSIIFSVLLFISMQNCCASAQEASQEDNQLFRVISFSTTLPETQQIYPTCSSSMRVLNGIDLTALREDSYPDKELRLVGNVRNNLHKLMWFSQLEYLDLSDSNISNQRGWANTGMKELSQLPCLRGVNLSGQYVDDEGLALLSTKEIIQLN